MHIIERNGKDIIFYGFPFWNDHTKSQYVCVRCTYKRLIVSNEPTGHWSETIYYIKPKTQNTYLWNFLYLANNDTSRFLLFDNIDKNNPQDYYQVPHNKTDKDMADFVKLYFKKTI